MVYAFFKYLTKLALRAYFSKIYISGIEKFPKGVPVFIASNHPNGFTEPLLLACFLPRSLHFLVRGDMFENPIIRPLLYATNQIPIYRIKDGFSNLRNNLKTFNSVSEVLKKNKAILIFVEGGTTMAKKLRPLQKGMARMIFKSLETYPDIKPMVVPISFNFSDPMRFRSEVFIEIGEPYSAAEMYASYQENKTEGIIKLTAKTSAILSPLVLSIDDKKLEKYEQVAPTLRSIYKRKAWPIVEFEHTRMNFEKKIVSNVNAGLLDEYTPETLETKEKGFLLTIVKLIALPGAIIHWVPATLTKYLAVKLVSTDVFYTSLRIAFSLLIFFVFYLFLLIVSVSLGKWYLLILFPIWGFFYLFADLKSEIATQALVLKRIPANILKLFSN